MNQRRLFTALDALPWQQIAIDHATIDRGHNRIDVRTIKTLPPTDHIRSLFPHVEQVFLLERYSYTLDGTPLGAVAVLGITSLPADQADLAAIAAYVRGHWSIESLHWLRDVVLGEDASTVKHAYQAMAALRNLIISVCALHGIRRLAQQLRANHRDPYRLPLLLLGLAKPNPNPQPYPHPPPTPPPPPPPHHRPPRRHQHKHKPPTRSTNVALALLAGRRDRTSGTSSSRCSSAASASSARS